MDLSLKSFRRVLGKASTLAEARDLQGRVAKSSHCQDLQPQVLEMFVRCGGLQDARAVLDSHAHLSADVLLAAYLENGHIAEAKSVLARIHSSGVRPWTSFVSAYARRGHFAEARDILGKMPKHNAVSWTALLSGYVHHGRVADARAMFEKMPERDVVSWNTVVKIFGEKGYLLEGRQVFERMPRWDESSWQTMISAYSEHGYASQAAELAGKRKGKDDVLAKREDGVRHCMPRHVDEAMKIIGSLVA